MEGVSEYLIPCKQYAFLVSPWDSGFSLHWPASIPFHFREYLHASIFVTDCHERGVAYQMLRSQGGRCERELSAWGSDRTMEQSRTQTIAHTHLQKRPKATSELEPGPRIERRSSSIR